MYFLIFRIVVSGIVSGATSLLATHVLSLYLPDAISALDQPIAMGAMLINTLGVMLLIGAVTFIFTWLLLNQIAKGN